MKITKKFWTEEKTPLLMLWTTACEDGRIICRPHRVTGPFQIVELALPVPLELLARAIEITDLKDELCP